MTIEINTYRVAAYLEQVDEDPAIACKNLCKHKILYTALKYAWTNKIDTISDQACQKLKKILIDHNITPILLASELGKVPANNLNRIQKSEIERAFNLASYFKTNYIRIHLGTKCDHDCGTIIDDWISRIIEHSVSANVVPVYEVHPDSHYFSHVDLAYLFNKFKKLKLLYDPAQFLLKRNLDPFIQYWVLLKNNIALFDVRDIKIGRGYKPAGLGDAHLKLTIADSLQDFSGWYILEPSLGRRYANFTSKEEIFTVALDAFKRILNDQLK